MKIIQQSTCPTYCPRAENILLTMIGIVLIISFIKHFEFVTSFQTAEFAGKLFASTKFNSNWDRNKNCYIKYDAEVSDIVNATSTIVAQRKELPITAPEASKKDRNDTYLISNENVCSGVHDFFIVILVHTATANFQQRNFIRKTWGNIKLSMFENHQMRVVFLLGKPVRRQQQTAIKLESTRYSDIVQGQFLDTYQNLTYKAVFGLRWVNDNCKQAKYVLKVDDDVVVNTPYLLKLLATKYANVNRTIFCEVRPNGTTPIFRWGKYKVKTTQFQNMTHWPVTYCPGRYLLYTADIIKDLVAEVAGTPFLWLDDVYVTGFLAAKAGKVKHLSAKDISQQTNWIEKANEARLLSAWKQFRTNKQNQTV